MQIFLIAFLATVDCEHSWIGLGDSTSCDHFQRPHIDKEFKNAGITPKCAVNKGRKQWKWQCFLKCDNGHEHLWSKKPLKCKVFKDGKTVLWNGKIREEYYNWKPASLKGIDSLCNSTYDSTACGDIQEKYNVSNELLSWKKIQVNERQTRYQFS